MRATSYTSVTGETAPSLQTRGKLAIQRTHMRAAVVNMLFGIIFMTYDKCAIQSFCIIKKDILIVFIKIFVFSTFGLYFCLSLCATVQA